EQQIKRHDLAERSRMPQRVRIGRLQHRAAIAVDDDGRIGRLVSLGVGVVMMAAAGMMVVARLGRAAGDDESRAQCGQAHEATTKPDGGLEIHPCHRLYPVPLRARPRKAIPSLFGYWPNANVTHKTRSSTLGERRCERVKSPFHRYFVRFAGTRCGFLCSALNYDQRRYGLFQGSAPKRLLNPYRTTGRFAAPKGSAMTTDEMQNFGKATMDSAMNSFGSLSKNAQ